MAGLVELDDNDKLFGEDTSSDEVLKAIQEKESTNEDVVEEVAESIEPEEEVVEAEEIEEGETEDVVEEEQDDEPVDLDEPEVAKPDPNALYRQGLQDALAMLKEKQTEQKKTGKKVLTSEEALDQLASDPVGFVNNLVDPYRDELTKVKALRARDVARSNPEYSKYEPIINKIRDKHPNLLNTQDPLETEEALLYIAKGMYQTELEKRNKSKTSKDKQSRLEKKKQASSLPQGTKKIVKNKKTKPIEQMTSDELEKIIARG